MSKLPVAPALTSTPSMRISVCAGVAPRIDTSVIEPGEPLWVTCTPGTWRSTSLTRSIFCSWICGSSTTVIVVPMSAIGCSILVAVTTTGFNFCASCFLGGVVGWLAFCFAGVEALV